MYRGILTKKDLVNISTDASLGGEKFEVYKCLVCKSLVFPAEGRLRRVYSGNVFYGEGSLSRTCLRCGENHGREKAFLFVTEAGLKSGIFCPKWGDWFFIRGAH